MYHCFVLYIDSSTREAGAAAEIAATRKSAKYSNLSSQHTFYPIAVETLDPLNENARLLFSDIGRHILTDDLRVFFFCFGEFSCCAAFQRCVACCTAVLSRTNRRNKCHHFSYFCNCLTTCGFVLVGLIIINVKNCSLYTLLTATDRKPQKS